MQLIIVLLLVSLFLIPISLILWFFNKLIDYRKCSAENTEAKKEKRNWAILSGIVAGVVVGGILFLVVSFTIGIMYM